MLVGIGDSGEGGREVEEQWRVNDGHGSTVVDVTHSRCAVLRIVEEDVVSKEKVGSHHQKVPLRGGVCVCVCVCVWGGGGGRGGKKGGQYFVQHSRDDNPAHQLRTLYRGRLYSLYLE